MEALRYKEMFADLNPNRNGGSVAPHKAIMLLSVIDLIETGKIISPFVELSDDLVKTFKKNWKLYVPSSCNFNSNPAYPFYYLKSSPFWKLEKLSTYEEKTTYSLYALRRSFSGARLPQDLFSYLQNPDFRKDVRTILITVYLSSSDSVTKHKVTSANIRNATLTALCLLLIA